MLGRVDRVCPLLGLAGERGVTIDGVDAAHRCFAEDPPSPLDRSTQAQLCLTDAHSRCERYLAYASRTGAATPGRASVGDGFVSTRLLLAPQPAWRGMAGRARTARLTPWVVVGSGVAALGPGRRRHCRAAAGRAGARCRGRLRHPDPGPDADAARHALSDPHLRRRRRPRARHRHLSRRRRHRPPFRRPSPRPCGPTPWRRATRWRRSPQRFGTTVSALQAANGIDDPDEIVIGQVLVIP